MQYNFFVKVHTKVMVPRGKRSKRKSQQLKKSRKSYRKKRSQRANPKKECTKNLSDIKLVPHVTTQDENGTIINETRAAPRKAGTPIKSILRVAHDVHSL